MKISGFTFLRNAEILCYPYLESIKSILPLVDEMVVNIGDSIDNTLQQVESIGSDKIRIIQSRWNTEMAQNGFVYAQQKMIAQYNCTGDWAFYLEGDEVLHEEDIPRIKKIMTDRLDDRRVEALAFNYKHFYGLPSQLAVSPAWYRREVRVIRNTIRSYAPDGLYWLVMNKHRKGRYPTAIMADASIYHYGHVRNIESMSKKLEMVSQFWGKKGISFSGYGDIDPQALAPFKGTHPQVMESWLRTSAESNFTLNTQHLLTPRERKHRLAMRAERLLGIDLSKKHFKLI